MILLIDNFDSFTYNLYQYLGEFGEEMVVTRNNELTITDIEKLAPEAIVISPGPGRPDEAGICVEVIQHFYDKLPILGICLGHQAIGYSFGARIIKADKIMHGKGSHISHSGNHIFQNLPQNIEVMRYHSLIIEKGTLPAEFEISALSSDDNEIMAIKHRTLPLYGMQFHPESIGTDDGKQMLANFLSEIREGVAI
ncbi:anthranilate synthase component II [Bacillus tuaregi]|uniref:anthranilate synthase component II n=1 Tax=Bacillus tuaregi TaxID=1816695 RepID=UPI0008F8B8EA|nr:aminodeoxychorismate/anthranilate synthase component II [Bacillus tuaregi]